MTAAAVTVCWLAARQNRYRIVALEGLGRYSELENAAARERFIIGPLASLLWAGACTAAIVLNG